MNGVRDFRITGAIIKKEDISTIVDVRNRVIIDSCIIENIDIATTNPNIFFVDCDFINSELIAPNDTPKASNCRFMSYLGDKSKRYPVRVARITNGYHTPVVKPSFID